MSKLKLSELISYGQENTPPKTVFYGGAGVGKTTFGALLYKPVFIQTESGMRGKLFKEKKIARFPRCEDYDELVSQIVKLTVDDHDHKTLVIDGAKGMQRLIFAEVAELKNKDDVTEIGFQAGYKKAGFKFETILTLLDRLVETKNMMVVILGHCKIAKNNPPNKEPYDQFVLDMYVDLATQANEWADMVLFCALEDAYTKKIKLSGGGEKTQVISTDNDSKRFIFTEQRPLFFAKNRDDLPFQIPFEKNSDSAWKTIQSYMFGKEEASKNENNKGE